jgi:hypothetical protein
MVVLLYLLAVLVDAVDLIDVGLVVVAVAAVDVVTLTVYSLEPVILAATVEVVRTVTTDYIIVAISATNLVFATATVEVVAALLTGDIVRALEPQILSALVVPSRSSDPLVPVTSFASATPPSISTPSIMLARISSARRCMKEPPPISRVKREI